MNIPEERRKKLLFVSYYVPPRPGVGTRRSQQLLKLLSSYGWDVTTVTATFNDTGVRQNAYIETNYTHVRENIKKMLGLSQTSTQEQFGLEIARFGEKKTLKQRIISAGFAISTYPDIQIGWLPHAVPTVRSLLATRAFDAMLSSSAPYTVNLIAALSRSLTVPWIADLRDLWTGIQTLNYSPLRAFLDTQLEAFALSRTQAITTVSQPWADYLQLRYERPTYNIPNAFDEDEWFDIPFGSMHRCTFAFAGQLYGARINFEPFLSAVRNLLDARQISASELAVNIYSGHDKYLEQQIALLGLGAVISLQTAVERLGIMRIERSADRLLLFLWDGPGTEGMVPGKLYEYLGARREVLAIGGPSESAVDGVLNVTGAGSRARYQTEIQDRIMEAIIQHRNCNVRLIDESRVAPFTARRMAKQFADALDEVVIRHHLGV